MAVHTHYDNLKVTRNAPDAVIRAAYKAMAQRHHPDLNSNPGAGDNMRIINEAYAVLCDPVRRAAHDRWIAEQDAAEAARDAGLRQSKADNQQWQANDGTIFTYKEETKKWGGPRTAGHSQAEGPELPPHRLPPQVSRRHPPNRPQ